VKGELFEYNAGEDIVTNLLALRAEIPSI
jgi:hypothetical protein